MLLTATNCNYEQNEKGESNKRRKKYISTFPECKMETVFGKFKAMFQQIAAYPAKRNGTTEKEKKKRKYVK